MSQKVCIFALEIKKNINPKKTDNYEQKIYLPRVRLCL